MSHGPLAERRKHGGLVGRASTRKSARFPSSAFEGGLAFITAQIKTGESISGSFGFKARLTKALRFQPEIETI